MRGARLLEVIAAAGIGWNLARLWPAGDRLLERRLKNWKKAWVLCPVCRALAYLLCRWRILAA